MVPLPTLLAQVTAPNTINASCGGLVYGATQYSQLSSVLNVLTQNSTIASAMSNLENHLDTTVARTDDGFFGWLGSTTGIIVIVVIVIVVLLLLFLWARGTFSSGGGGSGGGSSGSK